MKTRLGRSSVVTSSIGLGVLLTVVIAVAASPWLSAQKPSASRGQVTFAKDVAPILQRSCQNCHRTGSVAPMSLLTYEETRPWARAIKRRVSAREMPPWGIDRNVGIQHFKNDPSLSDAEIADDRTVGGRWSAAGEPGRHASAAAVRRSATLAHRQRQTGPDRLDAETAQGPGCRRGHHTGISRRDRAHRGPVHQGNRDQTGSEELQGRPPCVSRHRRALGAVSTQRARTTAWAARGAS